jgi:peptidoglycan/LPS O-acetylase OafA/YrhL
MSVPSAQNQRSASLDVLRAVAILLVLGRHMPEFSRAEIPFAGPVLDLWRRGGWIGVDLFFVLSGFLISGLLFREHIGFGEIKYGRFLLRRGFKIYPPFYLLLAVAVIVAVSTGRSLPAGAVWCEALFVQNYGPSLFPHTWSLAVEEHFYLLLPLLLLALSCGKKTSARFAALPWICGAVALAALAGRILTIVLCGFSLKGIVFPTHLRIDSLLFGVTLSYFHHFHRERLNAFLEKYRVALGLCAAVFFLPPFFMELGKGVFLQTAGLTLLGLGSGIVLLLMLHNYKRPQGPVAYIGSHSYSIYLWHIPVCYWIVPWLAGMLPPWEKTVFYFAASILLGILAAQFIETPVLALRDRVCRSRSQFPV